MPDLVRSIKIGTIGCLGFIFFMFVIILSGGAGITFGKLEVVSRLVLFSVGMAAVLLLPALYILRRIYMGIDLSGFQKWSLRIVAFIMVAMLTFVLFFGIGAMSYGTTNNGPEGGWTATTITLPHLTDGSRYVSNPDSVLTAETETAINRTMRLMDDELGIESAVIAVRRVENGDVFRFAQDIFDQYGIGKADRGLVIVLAVDNRKARVHTGYALEADFTDLETQQLQSNYLVPFMKKDMPDEALRTFTEACYNYLSHKDMPVVNVPSEPMLTQEKAVERKLLPVSVALVIWILLLRGFWTCEPFILPLFFRRNKTSGASGVYDSDSSYRDYSSSSSSSHHRSGGYSGGRSGGGGSTSSW